MQEYTLTREGYPPLKFNGEIIGQGDSENKEYPALKVQIYRTKAGKYIVGIWRLRSRLTDILEEPSYYGSAGVCATPEEVIKWVTEGQGAMGKVSQAAVEQACQNDDKFKAVWVEVVD